MILLKVSIDREKLRSIPESEAQLFVMIQVIVSEIDTLHRLLLLQPSHFENKIIEMAQNSQRLFLMRILAGKLVEAWQYFTRHFFGNRLSKIYEPLLSTQGKDALQDLKRYFGKANSLTNVRNKYSFHYSEGSQEIMNGLNSFPDSDPMEMYIAEEMGNCFYSMAQLLLNVSFVESFPGSNLKEKIEQLHDEIISVAKRFNTVIHHLIVAITQRHFSFEGEEIQMPDAPSLEDFKMPYFFSGKKQSP